MYLYIANMAFIHTGGTLYFLLDQLNSSKSKLYFFPIVMLSHLMRNSNLYRVYMCASVTKYDQELKTYQKSDHNVIQYT